MIGAIVLLILFMAVQIDQYSIEGVLQSILSKNSKSYTVDYYPDNRSLTEKVFDMNEEAQNLILKITDLNH